MYACAWRRDEGAVTGRQRDDRRTRQIDDAVAWCSPPCRFSPRTKSTRCAVCQQRPQTTASRATSRRSWLTAGIPTPSATPNFTQRSYTRAACVANVQENFLRRACGLEMQHLRTRARPVTSSVGPPSGIAAWIAETSSSALMSMLTSLESWRETLRCPPKACCYGTCEALRQEHASTDSIQAALT